MHGGIQEELFNPCPQLLETMGVLEEYFLNPILQNGFFNPVNTIVYALILVVAVFIVFRMLFRLGIAIDRKFFYAIFPFIFWGSSTRVLHDAAFAGVLSPELNAFYGSAIFPTPGSYLITFTLALVVLLGSLGVWRVTKIPYWKTMVVVGTILSLINIALLPWVEFLSLYLILGFTVFWGGIIFALSLLFKSNFFRKRHIHLERIFSIPNQVILAAHLLDASATFVALTLYGYFEQHVLPRFLFPFFGPISMFMLKIVVVLPVLWIIDSYSEDKNFKNFLKIVVFILGFAPGLRDLLRLMVGV